MTPLAISFLCVVSLTLGTYLGRKWTEWVLEARYKAILSNDYRFQEGVYEGLNEALTSVSELSEIISPTAHAILAVILVKIDKKRKRSERWLEHEGERVCDRATEKMIQDRFSGDDQ